MLDPADRHRVVTIIGIGGLDVGLPGHKAGISGHDQSEYPVGLIPLLGIMSSVALIAYISASRRLPLGLFGILGYVEPVLLFWVAVLLLHETPTLQAWFTYVPIWIAVAVMAVEGGVRWRRGVRGGPTAAVIKHRRDRQRSGM